MNRIAKIYDIDEIGLYLTKQSGNNTQDFQQVVWTPELVEMLTREIKTTLPTDTDSIIAHRGTAPLWVMASAIYAMYPYSNIFLPPVEGVQLKIHNLSQGEWNPKAEATFDITEKGDILYIDYRADDPNKPQLYGGGHHSYNPDLIPLIQAPVSGSNKHVCLSGNSSYNVTMSIATAYFSNCKSLSIKGKQPNGVVDEGYICCVTHSSDRKIGEITN